MTSIKVKIVVPHRDDSNDTIEDAMADEDYIRRSVKEAAELELKRPVRDFEFEDVGCQPGNDGWEMEFEVHVPDPKKVWAVYLGDQFKAGPFDTYDEAFAWADEAYEPNDDRVDIREVNDYELWEAGND